MKIETTAKTLLMCALIALSSCTKKPHTPTEEPQPVEVGFTAASQAVWVKGETDPKTTFPYTDFGVWGIARNTSVASPYILWTSNQLTKVSAPEGTQTNKEETNIVFTSTEAAYWLRDYSYDFLAIAPYNPSGLTNVAFTLKDAAGNTTGKDYMTFTYDMSSKYTAGDYAFDLLGAAAQNKVETGGYRESQNLMFWHLLSQIEIKNIGFASGINGTVTKVLFKAFPSGEYTISYDNSTSNSTAPTRVTSEVINEKSDNTPSDKAEITLLNPNFSTAAPIIHIIPQRVEYMELYIDFTINEGTSDIPKLVEYQNFKIDLNVQELDEYIYNGKYNWSITIGTKNAVSFNVVQVNDWQTGTTPDEIPLQ